MYIFVITAITILFIMLKFAKKMIKPITFFRKMSTLKWYKNSILAGTFVSMGNFAISMLMVLFAYISIRMGMESIILVFGQIGFFLSIWFWIQIGMTWNGTLRNKIVMTIIGSGYYFILFNAFLTQYLNMPPHIEGKDTFMASFGLIMFMVISILAIIAFFLVIFVICEKLKKFNHHT